MAVLKIFKGLTTNDWDVITKVVMDEKNNKARVSLGYKYNHHEKPDFIIIKRSYPENIVRSYCRCGYTSGNDKYTECPDCGNKNMLTYCIDNNDEHIIGVNYKIIPGDPIIMESTKFVAYADSKSLEFVFEEKPKNVDFKVFEEKLVSSKTDISINSYSLEELYNAYKYEKEDFKYYYDRSVMGFLNYIQYRGFFPVLMEGISKYPNIVNAYCKDGVNLKTHPQLALISSFDDVLKKLIKCPADELLPHMNKLFIDSVYNYRASRWGSAGSIDLNIFENFYNLKTDEMKRAIIYVIAHSNFTGSSIKSLLDTVVNTSGFDKDEEALFANYLMANYITEGPSVYAFYDKKKKDLLSWGYKPVAANLEKRNFNIIKNLKELESRGYNPKKASFFMDCFELDPLSSLKYLDSRRAPNKEMKAELLKKVD